MFFGFINGLVIYQRYINNILFNYLNDFCTAYFNNIFIYLKNILKYKIHVKKVLQRLRNAGFQINIKKFKFNVTSTRYLKFIINTENIRTDFKKTFIIRNWNPSINFRGVQSFLGFYNFYRRFIKNYDKIAKAIINLTKINVRFDFNKYYIKIFEKFKARMISSEVLKYYNFSLFYKIETDASDEIIVGIFF